MKSQSTAFKFAITSVFLWSTVATAFKISLKYLTPTQLVLYASLSSFFVLLSIIIYKKSFILLINYIRKSYIKILFLALINPFAYYLILFEGYNILPAQEAQAINYTWALMLSYLSVIFLKQKLTLYDIFAGIICYFGVLIISTKGDPFSLNFSNLQGVALVLLSTILWSIYWIINAKNNVNPIIGVFANFLFSLPIIIIYSYLNGSLNFIPSSNGLFAAFYVGIFEMGITFLFWLSALKYAESTAKIANLIFISPFLSLLFISFILNEKIYLSTIIGLTTIIFGLFIQKIKK